MLNVVRERLRAPMICIFHAVCADFGKVRASLRAFDRPVAGLVPLGDGWMKRR